MNIWEIGLGDKDDVVGVPYLVSSGYIFDEDTIEEGLDNRLFFMFDDESELAGLVVGEEFQDGWYVTALPIFLGTANPKTGVIKWKWLDN